MEKEAMIDWLNDKKDVLSIRAIEQRLGMPSTTLTKAMTGAQSLPKKWHEALGTFITNFKD